jgi:hypothetical protein
MSHIGDALWRGKDCAKGGWEKLSRVYDHAMVLAKEAEYAAASNPAHRGDPVYPPLVLLLADAAPEADCPF